MMSEGGDHIPVSDILVLDILVLDILVLDILVGDVPVDMRVLAEVERRRSLSIPAPPSCTAHTD
jgi:hypothetical protein